MQIAGVDGIAVKDKDTDGQIEMDANQIRAGTGYTNLEIYLGWLVGDFPGPKNK
jgi:hypothetical protein